MSTDRSSSDRATTEPLEATSASKQTFLKPGTEVLQGRFRVVELLGKGGMGEVYLAEQVSLGRKVAVKLLSAEFVKNEDDQNRFLREARAAAAVRHANVVDVLDILRGGIDSALALAIAVDALGAERVSAFNMPSQFNTDTTRGIAAELAQTPGLRSDDVPDIEIAALAIEHGLVLASHDHGFRRFSGLRVVDPLTLGST